jgi:hypothetical protein
MNENIELFVFRILKYVPSTSTPIYAYVTVDPFTVILPRFIATPIRRIRLLVQLCGMLCEIKSAEDEMLTKQKTTADTLSSTDKQNSDS